MENTIQCIYRNIGTEEAEDTKKSWGKIVARKYYYYQKLSKKELKTKRE